MRRLGMVTFLLFVLFASSQDGAQAFVAINEILADPPAGIIGDANGDGIGSTSQDEFIELLNMSDVQVDISGWQLHDALKFRHSFPQGSILPSHSFFVVFSGGNPMLPGVNFSTASSGALGLNNTNEEIFLYDNGGILIDHVVYATEGGKDQSIVRFPEGVGTQFVLHSSLAEAQGRLFSPGQTIDGQSQYPSTVTPEPATLLYLGLGFLGVLGCKRRRIVS